MSKNAIIQDDEYCENIENKKRKLRLAIEITIAVVAMVLLTRLVASIVGTSGAVAEQPWKNNEDVEKQKVDIESIYERAGVELEEDDFTYSEKEDGTWEVSIKNEEKFDELQAQKNDTLREIAENGGYASLFVDDNDGGGDEMIPAPPIIDYSQDGVGDQTQPNTPLEDNDGEDVIDDETDDGDQDQTVNEEKIEKKILKKMNKQLNIVKSFIDRTLAVPEEDEDNYYADIFESLLNSIRTGKPDPNKSFNGHDQTNQEAFYDLCGFLYHEAIPGNDLESTWDNVEHLGMYSKIEMLNSCIKNNYYDLKFEKIDGIFKEDKKFSDEEDEIESKYIVYSNGRTIYLTNDFYILDVE